MRKVTLSILLLCSMATGALMAQQASTPQDRPAEPNLVFDDDGGAVQIVPADFAVAGEKKFHGGAVLKSAQQVSIFLGSGWGERQIRSRQANLLDVAPVAGSSH